MRSAAGVRYDRSENGRAVKAAYQRQWRRENPDRWVQIRNKAHLKWQKANRQKANAHKAVWRAIKRGDLIRPDHCSRCDSQGRIEASHDDYSKPLQVEWLCRSCHARKDRTF